MIRVAWLTGASWRGGALREGELPAPDAEDFALAAPLGMALGISLEIRRWDDPDIAAQGFAAALVRSTWDYADRVDAFIARLTALEAAAVRVFNPPAVVRWNARKTYLEDLAEQGAPTIPTLWAANAAPELVARAFETFEAAEIVIKPQLGAGSRQTIRLKRNAWTTADLIGAPTAAVMIQPFLPGIQTTGETSLFYFGGAPAHVIQKRPAPGGWYANVDGARFVRGQASPAQRAAAEQVLSLAPAGMLYARVDLVDGADGRPRLIELEAIEPYLFFGFAPDAAAVFVDAVRAALA
ncbi:MAG: hypothetical protein NW200_12285 [Hyphomonadaceae bacterium]|nr:hypothetical protein [Hyphomonadaceae bacterium]